MPSFLDVLGGAIFVFLAYYIWRWVFALLFGKPLGSAITLAILVVGSIWPTGEGFFVHVAMLGSCLYLAWRHHRTSVAPAV
jgi:hypothetical protein